MYKFVDTIEAPGAEEMPAEAMKINGEYIENLMDSRYCTYRTLYVEGREMLSPSLSSFETGVRDGSSLLSKRYPARTITVGYKLQATSNYYFRMAYNELNRILNVENAEIIFYDEQDKYFTGTPSGVEEDPEPGTNFVQGEFTVFCADPCKYSVKEYEVEPMEDGTFVIDYGGTYKGYPELEADFYEENSCGEDGETPTELTGSGDCGYVAWFMPGEEDSDDARIIQLGDPEESDEETYAKSQTLMTQSWKKVTAWTAALNNLWEKNNGIVTGGITKQGGTTAFVYSDFSAAANEGMLLCGTEFDSASDGEHGPTVTYTLPEDASGEIGAVDWTLKYVLKFCINNSSSSNKQMGMFEATVSTDTGRIIAGMSVYKQSTGTSGTMRAYINGSVQKTVSLDLSYRNSHFGTNTGDGTIKSTKTCTITKSGDTVTMNLAGTTWSFTNANIKDLKAIKVTFAFCQYKSNETMYWNGIYSCSFTKNNCTTWADIPNKFTANDTAVADCTDGEVYVNDAPFPSYGAIGNDWEKFYLVPGYNQIGFSYSDWCETPPTSKIRYREVFL